MSEDFDLGALFAEYEKTNAVTVLPDGKHKLEVLSASVRNKGIMPSYKILEGPDAGKRAMAGGIYPGDTEGGRAAFFRKLEKFGLDKNFFAQKPSLQDVANALKGRVVVLELSVKDWQGEPRNEMGFNIELISAPALPGVGGAAATPQAAPAAPAPAAPAPAPAPVAVTPVPVAAPPAAPVAPAPAGIATDPDF